jgi:hypothetical protein
VSGWLRAGLSKVTDRSHEVFERAGTHIRRRYLVTLRMNEAIGNADQSSLIGLSDEMAETAYDLAQDICRLIEAQRDCLLLLKEIIDRIPEDVLEEVDRD